MKKMTAKVNTKLKKLPVDSSQLKPEQMLVVTAGKTYGFEAVEPAKNGHSKVTLAANSGTFYAFTKDWDGLNLNQSQSLATPSQSEKSLISKQEAEAIFGNSITQPQLKDLNDCLNRYEINTKSRICHFISQIAHESGGLQWLQELSDGWYLEGRDDLGNIDPGDGPKYKGSGVIQLTGRANYQGFCNAIGDNKIMEGCDYVAQTYPFTSAGFWWQNNNMNELCDRGASVEEVTLRVNGGYNGLEDRQYYYGKASQIINIQTIAQNSQKPAAASNSNLESKSQKISLPVPWFPQTDNAVNPHGTCNSSSCAMCLEYFRPGTLPGEQGDDKYIEVVYQNGDSTDHQVQTQTLLQFGLNSTWHSNLGFEDVYRELEAKRPVVIGILHTGPTENPFQGGGHIIVVLGKTENGDFIVNDPYGSFHDEYKGAVENGKGVIYTKYEMTHRWTVDGPGTGWGRLFQP